jgi:hypothetical protein
MHKLIITSLILIGSFENVAHAENVLQYFETQALKENPKFTGFNTDEGKRMFFFERTKSTGEKVGCTTCHTNDPKATGKTRANKLIEPLAPVANAERFTDTGQVEKWFQRNCKDVFERPCTTNEKGNFVKFILSIK